ncbi:MAG: HEAT repeat domain-containing protein [Leptolyngbyaceae cyanobacterium SM2_5_2]|nr:HEAT repeat domain-containing protein [Leptolyngbyaceae cyanobacterium SM2_5_2]
MGDGLVTGGTHTAELIQAVQSADSKAAMVVAVRNLAAVCDPAAVSTLIEVLGYNNPGAAVAAVDGLVALGTEAVPALLNQLDGYNYGARAWAIRALSLIGDPRALPILLEAASGDFALSVRRAAVRGLGNINWGKVDAALVAPAQDQVLQVLVQTASDPEWVVRYAGIAGIEALALALRAARNLCKQDEIMIHLRHVLGHDDVPAVQARAQLAIETVMQSLI